MFKRFSPAVFMVMIGFSTLISAETVTLDKIKNSLICTCECSMTVNACQGSMACTSAEKLNSEAKALVEKGLSEQEILAAFINRYGEKILAAPTKKGFNLLAWILPYIIFILAGAGIGLLLRKWVRQRRIPSTFEENNLIESGDKKYEQQLDKVLHEMDY